MAWQDRHKVVPAVYLLFRDRNKVLLMRRKNTGYMDGMYSVPSGHLDGGEPANVAACREGKEETGVDISPEDVSLVHTAHRKAEEGDHERIDLYFEVRKWQGKPENTEPDKCDDLQWFDMNDIPENIIPSVRWAFDCIAKGQAFSSHNF